MVGLVVKQQHGNVGLLEEKKVYDWASPFFCFFFFLTSLLEYNCFTMLC